MAKPLVQSVSPDTDASRILIVDDASSIHEDFVHVLTSETPDRPKGEGHQEQNRLDELEGKLFDEEPQSSASDTADLASRKYSSMPVNRYQFDHAYKSQEAIDRIGEAISERRPYDLIFMDVRMPPGMDGIKTIKEILDRWPDSDTDIVVCTAFSDYSWQAMLKTLNNPSNLYFIRKPFDRVAILQLTLSLTENRKLKKSLDKNAARLDEQLKISEKRLRMYETLFNQSHDGLFHYYPETGGFKYNPALVKMWGYGWITSKVQERAFQDALLKKLRPLYRSLEKKGLRSGRFHLVLENEAPVWLSASIQLIYQKQRTFCVKGTILDVTDKKMREKAERDSAIIEVRAETKSKFLNQMSHELRAPVNGVLGLAELLKETTQLTQSQQKYVQYIHSSADSLLRMVNDMLDLAKVESGSMEIESIPFDLYELIDECASVFLLNVASSPVEFLVDISASVERHIIGDPTRIRQILINLLSNAFKFTTEGCVTLRINVGGDASLRFDVIDTGIGMTAAQQSKLFKDYVQADATISRKFGGTGLGLVITKKLISLMGGNINVTSEYGRGSAFSFSIPFQSAKQSQLTDQGQPTDQKGAGRDWSHLGKALIISSSPAADLLSQYLNRFGIPSDVIARASEIALLVEQGKAQEIKHIFVEYSALSDASAEMGKIVQQLKQEVPLVLIGDEQNALDTEFLEQVGVVCSIDRPVTPLKIEQVLLGLADDDPIHSLPKVSNQPKATLRALVADDSEVNQMIVEGMLRQLGVEIDFVADGLAAVEALRKGSQDYDVVLMDCEMPELDGYRAAEKIRELAVNLPIIAVSAHSSKEHEAKAKESGMNYCLDKPVTLVGLKKVIQSLHSS